MARRSGRAGRGGRRRAAPSVVATVSGSFDDAGQLDIGDGRLILCVGKKRSGKSIMGLLLFQSYPGDKVVIDVAKDDGPMGPDVVELRGTVDTLPTTWPEDQRKQDQDGRPLPMTLRYAPDAGSPTFAEDMDHVIGLAVAQGDRERAAGRIGTCILVHEIGRVAPANRTQPHMSRVLNHNRHSRVSAIMCGPRPKTIDPLVVQQADVIYIFALESKADRQRLAENMDWPEPDLAADLAALRAHEYLRLDTNEEKPDPDSTEPDLRLTSWPALPGDVVGEVRRRAGLVH